MIKNGKFNGAHFFIPSFAYVIAIGGLVAIVQLLMIYIKTGEGLFSSKADTTTIVYTMITFAILFFSAVIPLIAFVKRCNQALVLVESNMLIIQDKVFRRGRYFDIANIVSVKLYINEDDKRSSLRVELKSGQVVLLQLYYVLIDQNSFKDFMLRYCNIAVLDW